MKINAGVILTDQEVRRLTEAGCEIYPMKWVDTDKNAYQRRDNDYEGLRDVDSYNIVCSWCAQAHVSIHSCNFTNGYFQGQEVDRIWLYRVPAEGTPEEGIAGGEILASHVPVNGRRDAGRGL